MVRGSQWLNLGRQADIQTGNQISQTVETRQNYQQADAARSSLQGKTDVQQAKRRARLSGCSPSAEAII